MAEPAEKITPPSGRRDRRGREGGEVLGAPIHEGALGVRLAHAGNRVFAHAYQHLSVLSPCRLPASGPALLVSNHTSGVDPLFLQACCPRIIRWMMAREFYELKALHPFFRQIGIIPVERSGRDMAATRAALRVLTDGGLLGIFPEGRIEPKHELLPFQVGVALLAIKGKAPVYPAYVEGTQRGENMLHAFLRRNETSVIFGPPIEFDRRSTSREALEAATVRIQAGVEALRLATPRKSWW